MAVKTSISGTVEIRPLQMHTLWPLDHKILTLNSPRNNRTIAVKQIKNFCRFLFLSLLVNFLHTALYELSFQNLHYRYMEILSRTKMQFAPCWFSSNFSNGKWYIWKVIKTESDENGKWWKWKELQSFYDIFSSHRDSYNTVTY